MLVPANSLRQMESYRRRVRSPARASRTVYLPVHNAVLTLTPRHFQLEGPCRTWSVRLPHSDLLLRLRDDAVFTLDSALGLAGLRPWTTDPAITAYVSSWDCPIRLAAAGLLQVADDPPGSGELMLCCLPVTAAESLTIRGFRVTAPRRLAEELLGRHGARLDLFARILHEPFFSGVFG